MESHSLEQVNHAPAAQESLAFEVSLKMHTSLPSSLSSSSSSSSLDLVESADIAPKDVSSLTSMEQVDTFLIEALNSRNRLTVLRIDQEVERFMRNSKQQQLQCRPMPSSYERLSAHRVAQHYHLQSMVADCGALKGTRIVLIKTPDSRIPETRLADIPIELVQPDRPASVPPEKFAIKQRQSGIFRGHGCFNELGENGNATPVKTMEERKEEYNKARARIFNSSVDGRMEEDGASDDFPVPKLGDIDIMQEFPTRGILVPNGVVFDDDFTAVMRPSVNRVAIFRDREKDRKDPDYDRSYDRYSQRLNATFGMPSGFFGMHAMHAPFLNMNNDFARADGSAQTQVRVDQASYIAAHHHQGPWVSSAGSMRFYPDAFGGQFTQGQAPASPLYFATPRFSHSDHYSYMGDGLQHGLQPGMQYQLNFREVRNQ